MADQYSSFAPGLSAPSNYAVAVTPDSDNDIEVCRSLYVGTQGDLVVDLSQGRKALGVNATASIEIEDGVVTSIPVVDGGYGYDEAPTVTINDADGSGAEATAVIVGGVVTSITVDEGGEDYSADATVTLSHPGYEGPVTFKGVVGFLPFFVKRVYESSTADDIVALY